MTSVVRNVLFILVVRVVTLVSQWIVILTVEAAMVVRAIVEVMISLVVSFVVAVLSSSSFVMMMRSIILVVHFWLRRLDTRVGMGVSVAVVIRPDQSHRRSLALPSGFSDP